MPLPARRARAAAAAAAAAALACVLLARPAAALPTLVILTDGTQIGVVAQALVPGLADDPRFQQAPWFGKPDEAAYIASQQVGGTMDDPTYGPPLFVYETGASGVPGDMTYTFKAKKFDGSVGTTDVEVTSKDGTNYFAFLFVTATYVPVTVNGASYNVKGAQITVNATTLPSLMALPWWGSASAAADVASGTGDALWSATYYGTPLVPYDSYTSGGGALMIKTKQWVDGATDYDFDTTSGPGYFTILYEGGGNADPHLQGFGGQRYDFCMEGPACRGRALALLTEARHQVNTEVDRFQGPKDAWPYWGNWMVGFGMLHSSGFKMQLRLDTDASGFKVKKIKKGVTRALLPMPDDASSWRSLLRSFEANGQDLLPRVGSGDSLSFGPVTVYLPASRHAHDPTDGPVAVVTTPDLQITFYLESEDIWHLDFKVTLTPKSSIKRMHGLLGQSAHWADGAPAEVEGGDDLAYAVEGGLLGSSFKYSLYGRDGPAAAAAATRKLLAVDDDAPLRLGAAGSPASLLLA